VDVGTGILPWKSSVCLLLIPNNFEVCKSGIARKSEIIEPLIRGVVSKDLL
jgi:hypothetical protein